MEKGFKILLAIFVCVLLCTLTGCKKNKHNLEKVESVAATCTTDGLKEHYKCDHCDELFKTADAKETVTLAELTIPAFDHDYEITYDFNISTRICKAVATCKHDSSHKIVEEGIINVVDQKEMTCESDGFIQYAAQFSNDLFDEQKELVTVLARHTYSSECDVTCDIPTCGYERESDVPHTVELGFCTACGYAEPTIANAYISYENLDLSFDGQTIYLSPKYSITLLFDCFNILSENDLSNYKNNNKIKLIINDNVIELNDIIEYNRPNNLSIKLTYEFLKAYQEEINDGTISLQINDNQIIEYPYKIGFRAPLEYEITSIENNTTSLNLALSNKTLYMDENDQLAFIVKGTNLENLSMNCERGLETLLSLKLGEYIFSFNDLDISCSDTIGWIYLTRSDLENLGLDDGVYDVIIIHNETEYNFGFKVTLSQIPEELKIQIDEVSVDTTSSLYDAETKTYSVKQDAPLIVRVKGQNIHLIEEYQNSEFEEPFLIVINYISFSMAYSSLKYELIGEELIIEIPYSITSIYCELNTSYVLGYSTCGTQNLIITEYNFVVIE